MKTGFVGLAYCKKQQTMSFTCFSPENKLNQSYFENKDESGIFCVHQVLVRREDKQTQNKTDLRPVARTVQGFFCCCCRLPEA